MNTLAVMVDLLKAQSALNALTSGRIYGAQLPAGGKTIFPCVLIVRTPGGNSDVDVPTESVHFDIRCYGNNQPEANSLYAALQAINGLERTTVGSAHVYRIEEMMGGCDLPEQVSDSERWDCVFCSYILELSAA